MNKDNAAQYLPLVQALAEGRVIQFLVSDGCPWQDWPEPDFSAPVDSYRIKPEPRKAWVWWPGNNKPPQIYTSDYCAMLKKQSEGGHITEVTE